MVFGCGSRALRRLQRWSSGSLAGVYGGGGLQGWLLGSTAAAVLRDGFQGLRRRRSSGVASRVFGVSGLQGWLPGVWWRQRSSGV